MGKARLVGSVRGTTSRFLGRWLAILLLALLWELASRLSVVNPLLLPPLSKVLARGWHLLVSGGLIQHLVSSALRVFIGFGLAAAVAVPLGIGLGLYPPLEEMSRALLGALRPLSPPAWIPLAILWFGIGDAPAVFIIFVGTCLSMLVGLLAATRAVDAQLLKTAFTLGAGRWGAVRHVVLPSLTPALLAQLRLGVGLAWMCVIAAEMVAVRHGIGFFMVEARNLFRTEDVIAGMITIGCVGVVTDRLLHRLEHVLCPWQTGPDPLGLYLRREEQL